jgi:hypothetical protein
MLTRHREMDHGGGQAQQGQAERDDLATFRDTAEFESRPEHE